MSQRSGNGLGRSLLLIAMTAVLGLLSWGGKTLVTDRIATLEAVQQVNSERLSRIEGKIDVLLERRR